MIPFDSCVPAGLGASYYCGLLNLQARYFYRQILAQLDHEPGSTVFSLTSLNRETAADDCFRAYSAIRDDHPEYFFLGNRCRFTSQYGRQGQLYYNRCYPKSELPDLLRRSTQLLQKLISGLDDLEELGKELAVYTRIACRLNYQDSHSVDDHNFLGPLLYRRGVCEGYTALLLLALRRLNIPCIKVHGKTARGGAHCWVIAWIGRNPVHLDLTWEKHFGHEVSYDFFNLSDRQIAVNHFDFQSPLLPACTCEKLSIHPLQGAVFLSRKSLLRYLEENTSGDHVCRARLDYATDTASFYEELLYISQTAHREVLSSNVSRKTVLFSSVSPKSKSEQWSSLPVRPSPRA